jgi:hypothetical protein
LCYQQQQQEKKEEAKPSLLPSKGEKKAKNGKISKHPREVASV